MVTMTLEEAKTVTEALPQAMRVQWDIMRSEGHKGPYYDAAKRRYDKYEALYVRLGGKG